MITDSKNAEGKYDVCKTYDEKQEDKDTSPMGCVGKKMTSHSLQLMIMIVEML